MSILDLTPLYDALNGNAQFAALTLKEKMALVDAAAIHIKEESITLKEELAIVTVRVDALIHLAERYSAESLDSASARRAAIATVRALDESQLQLTTLLEQLEQLPAQYDHIQRVCHLVATRAL